jgi:hypothetical protein
VGWGVHLKIDPDAILPAITLSAISERALAAARTT